MANTDKRKLYKMSVNGQERTFLLDAEDADRYGDVATVTTKAASAPKAADDDLLGDKAATAKNKAATAENK